jgi:aconitate hydratase 2/2-methylisocitrate dehydratase
VAEYMEAVGVLSKDSANIYKYMNFDQIEEYVENAKETTA